MATPVDALLLDMDGVLVDSEPLHMRAWDEVLRRLGLQTDRDWFDEWIGVPDRDLAAYVAEALFPNLDAADVLTTKRGHFRTLIEAGLSPMPGVDDGLRQLAQLPMAVVTNSGRDDAERSLALAGLQDYFRILVSADDVTAPKPAPEPYARAAAHLGVDPRLCIVIEDSPAGVHSARAAGCRVLAVTTTCKATELEHADMLFPDTASALAEVRATLRTTA